MATLQEFTETLFHAMKAQGLVERIKALPESEQAALADQFVALMEERLGAEGE